MTKKTWNKKNENQRRKPGEVYIEKARRGTFGEQTYGVYLQGDETLTGGTITLGLFFNEELAVNFFNIIDGSETIEKLRRELFKHPEDRIPIDQRLTISHQEWEQLHPELVKYSQSR